jgi:uracil DNA glycosylase
MKTVATSALNDETRFIRKLADLQQNMHKHGFLLLNATLVFRDNVAPVKDGKSWQPFLQAIFSSFWSRSLRHLCHPLFVWENCGTVEADSGNGALSANPCRTPV